MQDWLNWLWGLMAAPVALVAGKAEPAIQLPIVKTGIRADSFINDLSGLGGLNDKGQSASVLLTRPRLAEVELDELCKNCGIARRIVDLPAETATANGWYVRDPSPDTDPMEDEDERLQLTSMASQALKLGRKYGQGYTFLACTERIPAGYSWTSWQKMPLDLKRVVRVDNLINLDPLDCTVFRWDDAEGSPNFRLPKTYLVNGSVAGTRLTGVEVHWTRLLRWSGIELSPRERINAQGRDLSVLQGALDSLRNNVTVSQAGANYVQEMGVPVFKSPLLRANSSSEKSALFNAMMLTMAKSRSLLNMMLLEPDESIDRSSPNISGFKDLDDAQRARLCADVGIPMTILYGAEPGGLSTDDVSGRINWYATIQNYQKTRLTPQLKRLYRVLYAQEEGPTQGRIPKKWSIVYHPLQQLSDTAQVNLMKAVADLDGINISNKIYTAEHAARSRYGERGFKTELLPVPVAPPTAPAQPVEPAPAAANSPMVAAAQDAPPGSTVNLPLKVEIPAGESRTGISPEGKRWGLIMPCDYGEIEGTKGLDGEPVDYLLATGPRGLAFVVEQLLPSDNPEAEPELDEHKVVLGVKTEAEARQLLQAVYQGTTRFGEIFPLPEPQLLPWLAARAERRRYLVQDGLDLSAPAEVKAQLQQGLSWQKAGKGGTGGVPATVAWARRLAAGQPISAPRARKMRAWLAANGTRNPEIRQSVAADGPTPAQVNWALWGGDPGLAWVEGLCAQLNNAGA